MDPPNAAVSRPTPVLIAVFLVITVGAAIDLFLDQPDTLFSVHVLFELGLALFSLGTAGYLATRWYEALRHKRTLERAVRERGEERDAWKERAGRILEGLSAAMNEQFDAWKLTPAEQETALMLLKGYSHKRIGRLTDRSDRTVRQHAVAVYRKAGVSGRSGLSGFFLEDLYLPVGGVPETAVEESTDPTSGR